MLRGPGASTALKFGGMYSYYRKNENNLAGNNAGGFSGFLNTVPNSVVHAYVVPGTCHSAGT